MKLMPLINNVHILIHGRMLASTLSMNCNCQDVCMAQTIHSYTKPYTQPSVFCMVNYVSSWIPSRI